MIETKRRAEVAKGYEEGVKTLAGYQYEYSSFYDFVDFIDNAECKRENDPSSDKWKETSFHGDFEGSYSLDAALKTAESGWQKGADKMRDLMGDLADGLKSGSRPRTEMVGSRAGGKVNVPAYLQGEPRHMQRPEQIGNQTSRGKTMILTANFCAGGYVDAGDLILRGAAVGAVALILESMGYPTEINAAVTSTYDEEVYATHNIRVKRSNGYLNESSIAFALAHPCMLRRLMFRFVEQHDNEIIRECWGYGHPADMTETDADLYVPSVDSKESADWTDMTTSEAVEWIKGQVEDLTGQRP